MPWTAPPTFVTGNVLTAAQLNSTVRDDLNYLFDQPMMLVSASANQSIPNNSAGPLAFNTTVLGRPASPSAAARSSSPRTWACTSAGRTSCGPVRPPARGSWRSSRPRPSRSSRRRRFRPSQPGTTSGRLQRHNEHHERRRRPCSGRGVPGQRYRAEHPRHVEHERRLRQQRAVPLRYQDARQRHMTAAHTTSNISESEGGR